MSMNVLVTMVVVTRHAATLLVATPAPVELDIPKVDIVVQVILFVTY